MEQTNLSPGEQFHMWNVIHRTMMLLIRRTKSKKGLYALSWPSEHLLEQLGRLDIETYNEVVSGAKELCDSIGAACTIEFVRECSSRGGGRG